MNEMNGFLLLGDLEGFRCMAQLVPHKETECDTLNC